MTDTTFRPNFNQPASIEASLREIDRNKWLIEKMLLMPKHQMWIHREVQIARAKATNQIEGIGDEDGNPIAEAARKASELSMANALRAYDFIDYVSDLAEQQVDELVIRQLNREFILGAATTLTPGLYRRGQNHVGNYTPPDQGDVPALMKQFVQWLRETDISPVLKAGIAHLHFVAIHPFWDGNGRTARGLETLILQRSAYDFKKLLSMEKRLLGLRQPYFGVIERTLGAKFGPYDATPWLEFYVRVLSMEVQSLVALLTEWHRGIEKMHQAGRDAGLLARQIDAMAYILQASAMTRSDYIEITRVSPVTASRDLKNLVDKGLLVAEGRTSSRVYRLSERMKLAAQDGTQIEEAPAEQMNLFDGDAGEG